MSASRFWHIPFARWVCSFLVLLAYVLLLTYLAFSVDRSDKVTKQQCKPAWSFLLCLYSKLR